MRKRNSKEDRRKAVPAGFKAVVFRSNRDHQTYIELRSEGKWAVVAHGFVLNKDGAWEYEPQPSSRSDEFLKRTRFTLKQAIKLCRENT